MASWPEPEFETAIWLELLRLADARLTTPSKVTAIGGVVSHPGVLDQGQDPRPGYRHLADP